MKEYYVEIGHLSADEKQLAYDKMNAMSFLTSYYFGNGNRLIGLVVDWDRKDSFDDYVRLLDFPFLINYYEGNAPR